MNYQATALTACVAILATAGVASAVPPAQPNGSVPGVNKNSLPAGSAANAAGKIRIHAQHGSGETGYATLRQRGRNLVVLLTLKGAGSGAQPAHIHEGTCAKLDPAPKYPLQPVLHGTSVTTLKNVSMSQLADEPYAINVHRSANDLPAYVACGDLGKTMGRAAMGPKTTSPAPR